MYGSEEHACRGPVKLWGWASSGGAVRSTSRPGGGRGLAVMAEVAAVVSMQSRIDGSFFWTSAMGAARRDEMEVDGGGGSGGGGGGGGGGGPCERKKRIQTLEGRATAGTEGWHVCGMVHIPWTESMQSCRRLSSYLTLRCPCRNVNEQQKSVPDLAKGSMARCRNAKRAAHWSSGRQQQKEAEGAAAIGAGSNSVIFTHLILFFFWRTSPRRYRRRCGSQPNHEQRRMLVPWMGGTSHRPIAGGIPQGNRC